MRKYFLILQFTIAFLQMVCYNANKEGDNMTVGERIKSRRTELGLSADEVATALNKNRATVYRYESEDIEKLPTTVLEPLAKVLRTTPAYLMGWENEENKMPSNAYPVSSSDFAQVPILRNVAAGLACHCDDNIIGYELVDKSILCTGEDYVYLRVKGDSMSPMLQEGDLVLVKCVSSVDSGSYAVVIVDGEDGLVKKVVYDNSSITLISENPYYPPREFIDEDVLRVRVFGKVIESKRKY